MTYSSVYQTRVGSETSRRFGIMATVLLLGLMAAMPASAQERARFLRWAYQDAGAYALTLGPRLPVLALGSAVLLMPSSRLDALVLGEVQHSYRGGLWGQYLDLTNELGGTRVAVPLVGLFSASLLTKSTRFQDAAFTSLQAWVYAGLLTTGLKYLFGRYRPETGSPARRFDPFSGNTSFPSGHTTAAFAIVTPWVLYYPHPVTYGLFALSAGTAIARIARNKHWPTDVLAGAAVGYFTARWLVRRHQGHTAAHLSVTPVVAADAVGLHLRVVLP